MMGTMGEEATCVGAVSEEPIEAAEPSFLTHARFRLNKIKLENDLKSVLRQAAEISSTALRVARVGVWLYHHEDDDFVCEALYDAADPYGTEKLPVVKISSMPIYCTALDNERFLAMYDARTTLGRSRRSST